MWFLYWSASCVQRRCGAEGCECRHRRYKDQQGHTVCGLVSYRIQGENKCRLFPPDFLFVTFSYQEDHWLIICKTKLKEHVIQYTLIKFLVYQLLILNTKLFLFGFKFFNKFNTKMRKSSPRIIKQRLHATNDKGSVMKLPVMNDTRSLYSVF